MVLVSDQDTKQVESDGDPGLKKESACFQRTLVVTQIRLPSGFRSIYCDSTQEEEPPWSTGIKLSVLASTIGAEENV